MAKKSKKIVRTFARHAVKVAGKEYSSTYMAFVALRLPVGIHQRFRKELKAEGKKVLVAGKRKLTFAIVERAAA